MISSAKSAAPLAMPLAWFENLLATALGALASDRAPSPEDWMRRYQAGEAHAFDELYRSLGPRIFGYLLRMTRDRSAAEDLVQITFTKVHKARGSFLPGEKVLPWLFSIARRSFLDQRRRSAVRHEELSRDGGVPEPTRIEDSNEDLAETLENALAKIPPSYSEAIQLTKIAGLSVREAASVLATTEAAVKLRVHRGYGLLRKALEELEEATP